MIRQIRSPIYDRADPDRSDEDIFLTYTYDLQDALQYTMFAERWRFVYVTRLLLAQPNRNGKCR